MVKINKIQCETIHVIVILDMCSNVIHAKFLEMIFNTKLKCGSILVYYNRLCHGIVEFFFFFFCALVVLAFITAAEVAGRAS